jgi:hypothetical protein
MQPNSGNDQGSLTAPVQRLVRPFSRDKIGDILQAVYDSEINLSLSWCWDLGVEVKVYNTDSAGEQWRFCEVIRNEHHGPHRHDAVAAAIQWAVEQIIEHDPTSGFSGQWKAGEFC